MDRRQVPARNTSSESLNLHTTTNSGIRKSSSHRTRRRPSPHWSEEATWGSCTPSLAIPISSSSNVNTTLTQESFNAWMEAQRAVPAAHNLTNTTLPQTPDDTVAMDEWLGILPMAETPLSTSSRPTWPSLPVSTAISPITAQDYGYSPSPASFAGISALMPPASNYMESPLLFASTDPSATSFQPINDFNFSDPNAAFQQDLLGVGSFVAERPIMPAEQRPEYPMQHQVSVPGVATGVPYRRPLRYKPLSTWFHLWLV